MNKLLVIMFVLTSNFLISQQVELLNAETADSEVIFRNNGSSSNNGSQFLLGQKNLGFAAYYLDAANGDFSGLDYALLKHKDDLSLELVNLSSSPIFFKNGGDANSNTRLSISATGNIGVGVENATAKLQIEDGDIYLKDITSGVIMKSPNDTCWKVKVDDTGSLYSISIACP